MQDAVSGAVYAVSAAAVLIVDRAPHGAEHLRVMFVGNILTARGGHVAHVGVLFGGSQRADEEEGADEHDA